MQNQCTFATVEQEVFSAPHHLADFQPAKRILQIVRDRPAQIWISYRGANNAVSLKMRDDASTDNFDFR
jgi:hypothetical protein